jgi:hypothetical protein
MPAWWVDWFRWCNSWKGRCGRGRYPWSEGISNVWEQSEMKGRRTTAADLKTSGNRAHFLYVFWCAWSNARILDDSVSEADGLASCVNRGENKAIVFVSLALWMSSNSRFSDSERAGMITEHRWSSMNKEVVESLSHCFSEYNGWHCNR